MLLHMVNETADVIRLSFEMGRLILDWPSGPHVTCCKQEAEMSESQRLRLSLTDFCGEGWEERLFREFGMDVYTLLYLKEITSQDLLYSTRNSTQCSVATWMEEEFGGEWILWICMAESLCRPPESTTALVISYESESCSVMSTLCDSMD